MAELHGFLARVALVLILATTAWSGLLLATRRPVPPALVGGLIWVVGLLGLSGLAGVIAALSSGPPRDPLHLVYGALALAVLPGAWAISRSRPDARTTVRVLAVGSVVLIILVVRLFQTGG